MSAAPRDRRGGYILVAVLAVVLMLTGLLAAGTAVVRSALNAAKVADADVEAAGLTTSGLEIAAYQLTVIRALPADVDGRRIRLTGGTVSPRVVDEGGKIDLNGADPKLLASLLDSIGMDQPTATSVVAAIVALRGPPKEAPAAPGTPGAPSGYSIGNGNPMTGTPAPQTGAPGAPKAKPKRGFQSVEDIGDIEGVTRADMRLLRPRLTVYNPDGKIDVLTARADVLAVIPGINKFALESVLAGRGDTSKESIGRLQKALGEALPFTKVTPGPAFDVRIEAVTTAGRKRNVEAVVAASKSPNEPYYVLEWR